MCVSVSVRADRDTCRGVSGGRGVGVSKRRSVGGGLEGRHTNDTCSEADKKSGGKSSQVCTWALPPPRKSVRPSPRACQSALVIVLPNLLCVARAAAPEERLSSVPSRPARKYSSAFSLGLSVQDVQMEVIRAGSQDGERSFEHFDLGAGEREEPMRTLVHLGWVQQY